MFYDVPTPTTAIVISGGFGRSDTANYRISTASGIFSLPVIHRVHRFYTGATRVDIQVSAQSAQNVEVNIEASVVFSVKADRLSITRAARRFLTSTREEVHATAREIFSGATRAIIGTMTVEDMISDRMALTERVVTDAAPQMDVFGWGIDSFQINAIRDDNGYIEALSAPELARVEREREVARAVRDAEIAEARQNAERKKSNYERETALVRAENAVAIAASQAESNNAGPLAQAEADKQLAERQAELEEIRAKSDRVTAMARTELAEENARLRKQELVAEIELPAQAEAEATTIRAAAEAEATRQMAEALEAGGGAALSKEFIDKLPDIMGAYGRSLSGADVTIIGDAGEPVKVAASLMPVLQNMLAEARKIGSTEPNS